MPATDLSIATATAPRGSLRRNLSVWQAVGLSIALMAPRMAANLNPQPTAAPVGRAVQTAPAVPIDV